MVDIAVQKVAEARRWAAMHIKANRIAEFDAVAKGRLIYKARYRAIEAHLVSLGKGAPWWVIAVIHVREANGNFNGQLGQGDPLGKVSTHVPAGRGPFFGADAFERSCYDALISCEPHAAFWTDWTAGGVATILEMYNGEGYAMRGRPSPYVWSGSDQYVSGKYTHDGPDGYDPRAVDVQLGCMPLIARMQALDPSIKFASVPGKWTAGAPAVQPPLPHLPSPPLVPRQRPGWLARTWTWIKS